MPSECEYHEGEDALDCRACEKLHDEFVAWVASIHQGVRGR